MAGQQPTAAIERAGVKTVRWPATEHADPRYVIHAGDDQLPLELPEPRAREALRQLAYLLGCQVVPGG